MAYFIKLSAKTLKSLRSRGKTRVVRYHKGLIKVTRDYGRDAAPFPGFLWAGCGIIREMRPGSYKTIRWVKLNP